MVSLVMKDYTAAGRADGSVWAEAFQTGQGRAAAFFHSSHLGVLACPPVTNCSARSVTKFLWKHRSCRNYSDAGDNFGVDQRPFFDPGKCQTLPISGRRVRPAQAGKKYNADRAVIGTVLRQRDFQTRYQSTLVDENSSAHAKVATDAPGRQRSLHASYLHGRLVSANLALNSASVKPAAIGSSAGRPLACIRTGLGSTSFGHAGTESGIAVASANN